jgi:D-amino-acid dehydrogenase
MSNPRSAIVCGGGIVGLCAAHFLAREGFAVTVIERNSDASGSCAHGSAGYVSPSHVVPVSAPGMVWQGLKWMMSSRSPFYIKPRLDLDLIRWGWLFARSCTPAHTCRAAPVLRDLCLTSRKLFLELAEQTGNVFELRTVGLLNLCKTRKGLEHEARGLLALFNHFKNAGICDGEAYHRTDGIARLIGGDNPKGNFVAWNIVCSICADLDL